MTARRILLASLLVVCSTASALPRGGGVAGATDEGSGAWKVVSGPPDPHPSDHTATLLADGRVLVVGGPGPASAEPRQISTMTSSAADLYDPATGRWSPAGSTAFPRQLHTATRLLDGRVLVAGGGLNGRVPIAGGGFNDGVLATAELYDPRTGRWALTGPMVTGRFGHTATLLPDGRVLVSGGQIRAESVNGLTYVLTESAEVYDPLTGRWTATGSMADPRAEHAATLLTTGRVLVVAGRAAVQSGGSLKSSELYDPATGSWQTVPHLLRTARAGPTATSLPDGRVLVAGGSTLQEHGGFDHPTATCEIYDPATRGWSAAAPLLSARFAHSATPLPDGHVLVVGGLAEKRPDPYGNPVYVNPVNSAELYDPGGDRWSPAARPPAPTTSASDRLFGEHEVGGYHTATLLRAGVATSLSAPVLVVGSTDGRTAQLFSPSGFADQPTGEQHRSSSLLVAGGAAAALLAGAPTAMLVHQRRRSPRHEREGFRQRR